mgnify:CR=1 FL=1
MKKSSLNLEQFCAAKANRWEPWLAASIAAILILGIALGLMKWLGLFEIPQNDTGGKAIAATIGLVGALLSTVVTLVGIVFKYSIDDRNARQADLDAKRNFSLALEEEKRNRIETSIRALDLIGENNKDAMHIATGGALIALVSLGELDLAVNLLDQLWPQSIVTSLVAKNVLLEALKAKSEETQILAGNVLYRNVSQISQKEYQIWPIPDLGWRQKDLHRDCRLWLVLSAQEWMVFDFKNNGRVLPPATVVLHKALKDEDVLIVTTAAASLRAVVERNEPDACTYASNGKFLTVEDINKSLVDIPYKKDGEEIQKWISSRLGSNT